MKKSYIYGLHAVSAKLAAAAKDSQLFVVSTRQDERVKKCMEMADARGIRVSLIEHEALDAMVKGRHQGVVLSVTKNIKTKSERELFNYLAGLEQQALLLVLDGVTDPHNLGACLRVADGAGADAVIVPKANSAKLTAAAEKVASGAVESVNYFQVANLARVLKKLADVGFYIIGTDDKATMDIYAEKLTGNLALVLGAEGSGMRRLTKEHCQNLVSIPMRGKVGSLNVSTAAAVVLYEALRQRR